MDNISAIHQMISKEIIQDEPSIRESFLKRYSNQVDKFIENEALAFHKWKQLDSVTHSDEKKKHVSTLIFSAINLNTISLKLFLSGYIIAAGNLERQVIETLAFAILCSCKSIGILEKYIRNDYLSMNAINDLLQNAEKANIEKKDVESLKKVRKYYNLCSHPSFITIATSLSDQGWVFGAYFDDGKTNFYDTEITGHIFLSEVIGGYVDLVKGNILQW